MTTKSMNWPMILWEMRDSLANILRPEEEDILDEGFANEEEREDEVLENIKEEYGFEEEKMPLMKLLLLTNLNFFMVVSRTTLFNFLSPNNDKENLLLSLYSGEGQNLMTNNNLSTHVESGNIFY